MHLKRLINNSFTKRHNLAQFQKQFISPLTNTQAYHNNLTFHEEQQQNNNTITNNSKKAKDKKTTTKATTSGAFEKTLKDEDFEFKDCHLNSKGNYAVSFTQKSTGKLKIFANVTKTKVPDEILNK
ncbi:hypothetical protein ABK040_015486 [Willaertia magna]